LFGTCPLGITRLPVVAVAVLASVGLCSTPAAAETEVSRPSGLDAATLRLPGIHQAHRVHKIDPSKQAVQKVQRLLALEKAAGRSKTAVRKRQMAKGLSRVQRNKAIGMELAGRFGWDDRRQWRCLDRLWTKESNWNHLAHNPSSGAHGIPQALPGSKMGGVGSDWQTNPETQIKWGLRYIKSRYGTPCGAWAHFGASGWY
jgi:hypothetical protein